MPFKSQNEETHTMSKNEQVKSRASKQEHVEVIEDIASGKTTDELREIATTLQTQLQHHQTMAVKAQGALEVILQMLPQDEINGEESIIK